MKTKGIVMAIQLRIFPIDPAARLRQMESAFAEEGTVKQRHIPEAS